MQYGMDVSGSIVTEPKVLAPHLYKLNSIYESGHLQQRVPCAVDDYQYKADTVANLQQHFFNRHYIDRLYLEVD